MTYLVAVSGGVDSVCLLHMMAQQRATDPTLRVIVAHVDHGIRPDSADDERFVAALARSYQLPYVSVSLALGCRASEEKARNARYGFLFEEAAKYNARVVTAHHADDVVETVALNLHRGTGWRGLAVLSRTDVSRPLLALPKSTLYEYAMAHRLEYVEDSTNHSDRYLRNRIRHRLATMPPLHRDIANLRTCQLQLMKEIDRESKRIAARETGSRHFLMQIDETAAVELLGAIVQGLTGVRPPRPQVRRALLAIKTAKSGSLYQVGGGISLRFSARKYTVTMI